VAVAVWAPKPCLGGLTAEPTRMGQANPSDAQEKRRAETRRSRTAEKA
jgi:hypothetical protein